MPDLEAIVDIDVLTDIVEAVDTIVDECKVHVTDSGLEIAAVDPAKVSMCHLEADADAFEAYQASRQATIGVDTGGLLQVCKLFDDFVTLEYGRDLILADETLEVTFGTIDPSSIRDEPDAPEWSLDMRAVVEGRDVDRILQAVHAVRGGKLTIHASEDAVSVTAAGSGYRSEDSVEVVLNHEDCLSLIVDDEVETILSVDYLDDVAKPIASDTEVMLATTDEMPLKLRYSWGEGAVVAEYHVAPRVSR